MFAALVAWFLFEIFKILPNISEYQIVTYRQRLELIEILNVE